MFSDCSSLTSLDISNFNMDRIEDVIRTFENCSSLKTLYVPNSWDLDKLRRREPLAITDVFKNCPAKVIKK
jgi:hypothetical protein